MGKTILFDEAARAKMLTGINKLADAVAITMGPTGRSVMIQRPEAPLVTKDGVTVAKEISLEDPFENMGAKLVHEAARKTAEQEGDGTTTSTVLARAIFAAGLKYTTAGSNPMAIRRGIYSGLGDVLSNLKEQAIDVESAKDIERVGSISANGNKEVGSMLASVLEVVGPCGSITIEDSHGTGIEVEFVNGYEIDKGPADSLFKERIYEEAAVFVYKGNLQNAGMLVPMLEAAGEMDKPLIVVCDNVDESCIGLMLQNQSIVGGCIIKSPGFGRRKAWVMEDIALTVGATVYGDVGGPGVNQFEAKGLGISKVEVRKNSTVFTEGVGETGEAVDRLTVQLETAAGYDQELLEERIAKLTGSIAVIKVGGTTTIEAKELKARVEDALHATRSAVDGGIVAGGGVALLRASQAIDTSNLSEDEAIGARILAKSLSAPMAQIAHNCGVDGTVVVDETLSLEGNKGYNAAEGKYQDLIKAGVIDPTNVVASAINNAASVAATLLTTNTMVTDS